MNDILDRFTDAEVDILMEGLRMIYAERIQRASQGFGNPHDMHSHLTELIQIASKLGRELR